MYNNNNNNKLSFGLFYRTTLVSSFLPCITIQGKWLSKIYYINILIKYLLNCT